MTSQAVADSGKPCVEDSRFQSCETFLPKFYFFYGSLMDAGQLARVLGIIENPVTHPASITGYSCKMWGPYPALVEGPTEAVVHGVAFKVDSKRVATRLARYETDAYVEHDCIIRCESGETLSGATFKWRGGADDPKLREGSFNLRQWQSARR